MVMAGAVVTEWASRIQAEEAAMDMAEAVALMELAGLGSPTEGQLMEVKGEAEHELGAWRSWTALVARRVATILSMDRMRSLEHAWSGEAACRIQGALVCRRF